MINIDYFKKEIVPTLEGYVFKYRSFPDGDFGSLDRVEFEGGSKVGAVEFWSQGWIGIDIYDLKLDDRVFNLLLGPDEEKSGAITDLVTILNSN